MTYVQLLQNWDPLQKRDSIVFITNNPEETLRYCNLQSTRETQGVWVSKVVFGPSAYDRMESLGTTIVTDTRGYQSKLRKMIWLYDQTNIPIHIGDDAPNTGRNLNHQISVRNRAPLN